MTSQFGTKIIDFFNSSSRGENAGKNDHGVEIDFLLVSVEEEAFWDPSVESIKVNNRFEEVGLDTAPNRVEAIRAAFAYYRGEASTPEPSSLPFAQRRRIVILNMVGNAVDLSSMEILHNDIPQNSGAISASDEAILKAAINSVQPAVTLPDNDGDGDPDETDPDDDNDGLLDSDEAVLGTDPAVEDSDGNGISDADEDFDRDRYTNIQELKLLLTDPLDRSSRFEAEFQFAGNDFSVSFPTETGRHYQVECTTDLVQFDPVEVVQGTGSVESLSLGPPTGSRFYRVRIDFAP